MSIISDVILVGGSFLFDFGAAKAGVIAREKIIVIKNKQIRLMKKFCVIFFGLLLILQNASALTQQFNSNPKNYNVKLQIFEDSNTVAEFMVAIADNDAKREYGLMNLGALGRKHGMLFVFDHNQVINMWMKNTKIPLDMIFIDENDVIVNIKENATPQSLEVISSGKKARKILEINGGLSQSFGIKIGQKIR